MESTGRTCWTTRPSSYRAIAPMEIVTTTTTCRLILAGHGGGTSQAWAARPLWPRGQGAVGGDQPAASGIPYANVLLNTLATLGITA